MAALKITKDFLTQLNSTEIKALEEAPQLELALLTDNIALTDITSQLLQELQLHTRHNSALQLIIENVLKNQNFNFIAVSFNFNTYTNHSFSDFNINSRIMRSTINKLEECGYINLLDGSQALKLNTRIEVTSRFKLLLTKLKTINLTYRTKAQIVLKDSNKKIISFEHTSESLDIEESLNVINSNYLNFNVTLQSNTIQPRLRRIFNNSSFKEGGRFYDSSFQNLPSAERSKLLINGNEVIELDFANMHLQLLYIQNSNKVIFHDAYNITSLLNIMSRGCIKQLYQICLNTQSRQSALSGVALKLRSEEIKASASFVLEELEKANSSISSSFYQRIGTKLQFIDSRICEEILTASAKVNKCVLSVHDSFIAVAGDEQWLRDSMEAASKKILGMSLPLK